MNNITLGTEKWGYYETVAGGSGAVSLVIIDTNFVFILLVFKRTSSIVIYFTSLYILYGSAPMVP